MKKTAFFLRSASAFLAAVLLAGCMEFEYTGREFAPSMRLPKYYEKKEALPPGEYEIIGRAKITFPASRDREDVRIRLLDEAAARGADAVCQVSAKEIRVGLYGSDGEFSGPSDPKLDRYNLTPDGAPVQENLAGETVSLQPEARTALKIVVKALFLKNRKELEKIISDREKQLDKIIGRPSALPGEPN